MEFKAETDSTNSWTSLRVHTNIANLPTNPLSPGAEASWPCAARAPAVPATVRPTRPVAQPWSPGPSLATSHVDFVLCLQAALKLSIGWNFGQILHHTQPGYGGLGVEVASVAENRGAESNQTCLSGWGLTWGSSPSQKSESSNQTPWKLNVTEFTRLLLQIGSLPKNLVPLSGLWKHHPYLFTWKSSSLPKAPYTMRLIQWIAINVSVFVPNDFSSRCSILWGRVAPHVACHHFAKLSTACTIGKVQMLAGQQASSKNVSQPLVVQKKNRNCNNSQWPHSNIIKYVYIYIYIIY